MSSLYSIFAIREYRITSHFKLNSLNPTSRCYTCIYRMATLDIDQIRDILPHRYPFLFVDKIVEMEKDLNSTKDEHVFDLKGQIVIPEK